MTCTYAAPRGPPAAGSRRRAITGSPWRSRCSPRCPAPMCGSPNARPWPSAIPGFSATSSGWPVRVIAIDGPAASGKSSTAEAVARRLGWAHLDSGALYRALTLATLDNTREAGSGTRDAWSGQKIVALAEELPVRLVLVGDVFRPEVAGVAVEEAIRSDRVTRRVLEIAAIPEVRRWVNARQREAVQRHPTGVVVDGRDIGTVVFPDALLKVFLTASPAERARR